MSDAAVTGAPPPRVVVVQAEGPRGLVDVRGAIHAHSVYSHDACDGLPRDEATDAINEPCLDDLRRGLCDARHEFVMLTDHGESFARTEFPDVLLHRAGDTLVERSGAPTANWIACPDGARVLVLAGQGPQDMQRAATAQASIKRYGLQAAATRPFKLSAEPREREMANPLLLTSGAQYDAVWVIDSEGEFARASVLRARVRADVDLASIPLFGSIGTVEVSGDAAAPVDRYRSLLGEPSP